MAVTSSIAELLSFGPKGFGDDLAWGLLRTVEIAVCAYALGLAIGILGALGKLYGPPLIRYVLEIYTAIVRGVPELVLIVFLFYSGPAAVNSLLAALGFGLIDVNGFVAAVAVLGFVQGAYSTEVLRAAILAVPAGQFDAAMAFGMSKVQQLRRITIPAMLPNAIPGLANLWLIVIKDTALIAVVGYNELALVTKQAAGYTKHYMLFYLVSGAIYLSLTLFSGSIFNALERRVRRGQPRLS